MSTVTFNGQTFNFPNEATAEQIQAAMTQRAATTPMTDGMIQPEMDEGQEEMENENIPMLPTLNKKQQTFRDTIAKVETGGIEDPFIRTQAKPSGKQSGSSAYGTFQITKGLIKSYSANKPKMFEEGELAAMATLQERQQVALMIGGRDRQKFETGGSEYPRTRVMMQKFGYENSKDFLDAFDYGGDYGLKDDNEFQLQYEGFSRKMLNDTLKQAGGDQLEAASRWHGGSGWAKAKSKKDTNIYREKFTAYMPE